MHLTAEELLEALRYCHGELGGEGCIGCPNAVPGSEDRMGMCKCRVSISKEMIHFLENYLSDRGKEQHNGEQAE